MNTKRISRASLSLLLIVAIVASLLAANTAKANTLTVSVGGTNTIQLQNKAKDGYYTLTNAYSSNTNAATVNYAGSIATVSGVANGTSTITVTYVDSDDNSTIKTHIVSATIGTGVAGNTGNPNTGSTVTVNVGSTATVGSYYSLSSAVSMNTAIANVTQSGNTLTVTGVSAGNTTLSIIAATASGMTPQTYSIPITVVGSGATPTPTPGTTTNTYALNVGQKQTMGTYASVGTYNSSDSSVATVTAEGNSIVFTGVKAGTATLTYTATIAGASSASNFSYTVTVGGGAAATPTPTAAAATATPEANTSGLKFKKSEHSIDFSEHGKKKLVLKNMTLDGTEMKPSELVWLSTDEDILTVNKKTGVFKLASTGVVFLVAADPQTGATGSVKITVE